MINANLTVLPRTVHIWIAEWAHLSFDEPSLLPLLSPDEVNRAARLQSPLHRQRFIFSRSYLRKILSLYTGIAPEQLVFDYGAHGKPYLQNNMRGIQFNVSHSADITLFAITIDQEIGMDIQKIKPYFREDIVKRFFSSQEQAQLMALSENARIEAFYQIWSMKEAVIKTIGQGLLTTPLADFSIDLSDLKGAISLRGSQFNVEKVAVPEGYQAAVCTNLSSRKIFVHCI